MPKRKKGKGKSWKNPRKGQIGNSWKTKGVTRRVLKYEKSGAKKIAKREIGKARKVVNRKGQWSVAAEAMGWRGQYDSKRGASLRGPGYNEPAVQRPAVVRSMPASSSHLFKLQYKRKTVGAGDLLLTGTQKLGTIGTISGSGTNEAFVVGGTTRQAAIALSPDIIGGQMALDARNYNFYRFEKVRLIFVMNAPSTDALSVGIAYSPDPSISDFQTVTSDSIMQSEDYVSITRKQVGPVILEITTLKKSEFAKFAVEYDSTSSASKRLTLQGVFYAFFSAIDQANTTVYGDVLIEFALKCFNRAPDYGFTISIVDPKWAQWVWQMIQDRLRMELEQVHKKWVRDKLGLDEKGGTNLDVACSVQTDWATARTQFVRSRINRYASTERAAQILVPVPATAPQAFVTPLVQVASGAVWPVLGTLSASGATATPSVTPLVQDATGNSRPMGGLPSDNGTAFVGVTVHPVIDDSPLTSGIYTPYRMNTGTNPKFSDGTTNVVMGMSGSLPVPVNVSSVGTMKTIVATASSSMDSKAGSAFEEMTTEQLIRYRKTQDEIWEKDKLKGAEGALGKAVAGKAAPPNSPTKKRTYAQVSAGTKPL